MSAAIMAAGWAEDRAFTAPRPAENARFPQPLGRSLADYFTVTTLPRFTHLNSRRTNVMSFRRPGLYCVELRTARWEASVRWYREALGLRVMVRVVEDGYALLEAGDTRLALISRHKPGAASARWSLGFEVDDLDAAIDRLERAGSKVSRPECDPEGFREVVAFDPDGNAIRLFAWPHDTSASNG